VDPRAGLDTEATGKILCPCRESNLYRPVVQPVVRHYTARANPAPTSKNILLNSLSTVLDKLMVAQWLNKLPAVYEMWKFIT
jgi:hypothetical protein